MMVHLLKTRCLQNLMTGELIPALPTSDGSKDAAKDEIAHNELIYNNSCQA